MSVTRIDLSDYRPYIEVLTDRLNRDSLNKMSMTDAVKIAIEGAMQKIAPDVMIVKTRKKYERLNF